MTQGLSHFRPLAPLFARDLRRLLPADTYQAMLAEDFTPDGIAQARREMQAVAAAIPGFRDRPPRLPQCPAIMLSAARAVKGRERQHAHTLEHQRRYAGTLPDGRYEAIDSGHLIQAEQPRLIAARIRQLLQSAA